DGVTMVRSDDVLVSLRLLCDRRDELTRLRTQAACRLHRLLVELTPGGAGRPLRASRGQQLLAKLRPHAPVDAVRLQLAHEHLDDIRALDAKMNTIREQIATLVEQTSSQLTDLYGVGPSSPGGSWPKSRPSTGFPAGITSPPTTAPHPSMPAPASRSGTGSPAPVTADSTTRYT